MIISALGLDTDVLCTDVAVIGGGATGLALAARLKRDLVVVEGGNLRHDPKSDRHFAVELQGDRFDVARMRRRRVGGMGVDWSGRCADLNAIDFEARTGVDFSGWPISAADLAPWYVAVRRELGLPVGAATETRNELPAAGTGTELAMQSWDYALQARETPLDLARLYLPRFRERSRTLLTDAHAVRLVGDGPEIAHVELRTLAGGLLRIRAREFVLACGCIEASRLLLISDKSAPTIVDGVSHWLGRGFHQHILLDAGQFHARGKAADILQRTYNNIRGARRHSHETGLRLSEARLRQASLLNISATFRYSRSSPYAASELLGLAARYAMGREPLFLSPAIRLEFSVEQRIVRENAVSLSTDRDVWGAPRAAVRWTTDDQEMESVCAMSGAIADWASAQALGQFDAIPTVADARKRPTRESLHHMGGTRMSSSATNGVVDADLGVHGAANLSIVGGSVFPTGGHVNPTLTMLALGARLADRLNQRAGRTAPPASHSAVSEPAQ